MIRMKFLILSGWLFLFTVYLSEQAILPLMAADPNKPVSPNEPFLHFDQADHSLDFYTLPGRTHNTVPVPVIREPFFKWKFYLPERFIDPFSTERCYPEFVQDIWRCPTVAFVLFPYHEFL